jgi:hypothetical protein
MRKPVWSVEGAWARLCAAREAWMASRVRWTKATRKDVALSLGFAAAEWEWALQSTYPTQCDIDCRPPVRRRPAKSQRKSR